MASQFSVAVQDARNDVVESTIGTSPILKILTGSKPANCAAAETGTVLATVTLPSDWMAASSANSKAKSGTWQDSSADNDGTAGYFRIYNSAGSVCHWQGSVTLTAGGGDMTVDNTSFVSGQNFTVTSFTFGDGNP